MVGLGINANVQNDKEESMYSYSVNLYNNCTVKVYESNGDIRYNNNCDEAVKVRITYSYRTCKNVAEDGKMVKKWSDWNKGNTRTFTLQARYSNASLLSGDNCLEYDIQDFSILE